MRLWMIWAALAVIWGLQATAAALVHNRRYATTMYIMAFFFAVVGEIVRRRTRNVPVTATAVERKTRAGSRSGPGRKVR